MRQRLSPSSRLEHLLGALVTPWEFDSVDAWRDAIAQSARDAVGGHYSQVSLDPACGLTRLRSPDVDPRVVAEYHRDWVTRDPFPEFLVRRGITTYVRSTTAARCPDFAAAYEASPILNDFYRRVALHDAAGVLRRSPQLAQLTVFSARRSDPHFVSQAGRVMPLAGPAFLAGAQQVLNVAAIRGQFARSIDALPVAVALYDVAATRLHRNVALVRLLAGLAERDALIALLDHAAQTLSRMADSATMDGATSAPTTWRWRDCSVSGSIARFGIDGSPPLLMLHVTRDEAAADDAAGSAAATTGLTAREREVAMMLARGASNRAVAATLHVSEHTARRHTERVLRKLGVNSRAGVAAALGLVRDGNDA